MYTAVKIVVKGTNMLLLDWGSKATLSNVGSPFGDTQLSAPSNLFSSMQDDLSLGLDDEL